MIPCNRDQRWLKDHLILVALELDLPDIINLSLVNKDFNDKIYKNDYFWMNKLRRDFNTTCYKEDARIEYRNLRSLVTIYDANELFIEGIKEVEPEHVQIAIFRGINMNKLIDNKENGIGMLRNILTYNDNLHAREDRKIITLFIYENLLPRLSQFMNDLKFWNTVYSKLHELLKEPDYPEFKSMYEKLKDFYKNLAQL